MSKAQKRVIVFGFLILYLSLAVVTAVMVSYNGQSPSGNEALFHIYRGEYLFRQLRQGDWFPLYDVTWYNGVQLFRFESPLSAYVLAACIGIAGGNTFTGYYVCLGLILFLGALSWLLVGVRWNRVVLGGWIGALWFFLPQNLEILFGQGNLASALCTTGIPWLLYLMYTYEHRKRARYLFGISVVFCLLTLCQFEYAVAVIVVAGVLLLCQSVFGGRLRKKLHLLFAMLLGIGMAGIWLVPAVFRGLPATNSLQSGILNLKNQRADFWISVALAVVGCMVLVGLLLWERGKRWIIMLCMLFLVLAAAPALQYVYGDFSGIPAGTRYEELAENTLMNRAKEITKQRIALIDGGALESEGAYVLSSYDQSLKTTLGYHWTMADTSNNVVLLNEAAESGAYTYLFDRALNLGNDSVLVYIPALQHKAGDILALDSAAELVGYSLDCYNESYRLYHMETPECFGVKRVYEAAGIGEGTSPLAMRYPCMEELDSVNLNDYSFEDLQGYEFLYLDQFTYTDKRKAESLVKELADNGTRIVISATGIPLDEATGIQSFLGVDCQVVEFSNGYPLLTIEGEIWDTKLFAEGYSQWKTVFIQGLDQTQGSFTEMNRKLDFLGTVYNSNISVIALGLPYHYGLTGDPAVGQILQNLFQMEQCEVAEKEVIPLQIEVSPTQLKVESPVDEVNTTLAYGSVFSSNPAIWSKQNLLYVDQGETVISLQYPYFYWGLGASIGSLVVLLCFLTGIRAFWERRDISEVDVFGLVLPEEGMTPDYGYGIPERVKYKVDSLEWTDEQGRQLAESEVYGPGRYQVCITVSAAQDELFSKFLQATVNNFAVDELQWIDYTKVRLVMNYQAKIPFRFLQEPEDLEVGETQQARITWRISKPPKVGYLQQKEKENWVIEEVLPVEVESLLSIVIEENTTVTRTYRLLYIVDNGRTYTSREFQIKFTRKNVTPLFIMQGEEYSSTFQDENSVL